MGAHSFEDLEAHIGHDIVCARYGDDEQTLNVAIECETCGEVLVDYDQPDPRLQRLIDRIENDDDGKRPERTWELDSMMQDATNQMRANINNMSIKNQVEYLIEGEWSTVEELMGRLDIKQADLEGEEDG